MNGEEREGNASRAADQGEDGSLRNGALEETGCGGTEGGAESDLSFASGEAGELGVGQVDAGDEQDADDGSHEEPETGGETANQDLLERLDVGGEGPCGRTVEVAGGNLRGDKVGDGIEILSRLGDGDLGLEACQGDEVAVVAVPAEATRRVDHERSEDLVVRPLSGYRRRGELV